MIYFDSAATSGVCEGAREGIARALQTYANPSSLHAFGAEAAALLETCRGYIARPLGADPKKDAVIFTSGGTEANNLALLGTARAKEHNRGGRVIISDGEHSSVNRSAEQLEKEGFEVLRLSGKGGRIDPEALYEAVNAKTFLVSLMAVNNETGAFYDIPALCEAAKRKNPDIIFHTDAIQAFGKLRTPYIGCGVDLVSVSAHKIGGLKGTGALVMSERAKRMKAVSPIVYGGGQESGLRSGTENTLGIAAFAYAAKERTENFEKESAYVTGLYTLLRELLSRSDVRVNEPISHSPYIMSVTLPGIKSNVMLNYLSDMGIYVSSGSACSSNHPGISRPLTAYGLTSNEADCTVRISFFATNTEEEVKTLAEALDSGVKRLVRMRRR